MTKKEILIGIIKNEAKVDIGISKKLRYNVLIYYLHEGNTSFVIRFTTVSNTKDEYIKKLNKGYEDIADTVMIIYN